MSGIKYTPSMNLALTVKSMVDWLLNDNQGDGCYCEAYSNGREQGLHIYGTKGRVSFSENRNSDSIVVYAAPRGDFGYHFDMAGNVPRDGPAWENRRYFDYDQVAEAARYIISQIVDDEPDDDVSDFTVHPRDPSLEVG